MIVLGLTGSIASGKSTVAAMFAQFGARVFDADKAVHHLLAKDDATRKAVLAALPEAENASIIDRKKLGAIVFSDPEKLKKLETILHPRVRIMEKYFLRRCRLRGDRFAVCDIPLLFETGGEERFDAIVTVFASPSLQKARYLARPGANEARFHATLARQCSALEKHKKADFVVHTGLGKAYSMREVITILRRLGL